MVAKQSPTFFSYRWTIAAWHWRHNERNGVSNHLCLDTFLNCLFGRIWKKKIKAPLQWPLWGKSNGDRWFSLTKGQSCGQFFRLITSSCINRTLVTKRSLTRRQCLRAFLAYHSPTGPKLIGDWSAIDPELKIYELDGSDYTAIAVVVAIIWSQASRK